MKVQNRTVQRAFFNVRIDHTAIVMPKFRAITVKCTLHRNGQDIEIFHDNLHTLAMESMFFHCYEVFQDPAASSGVASGTGGGVVQRYPLMIDLKHCINVMNADVLELEVTLNDGWAGPSATLAGCYIDVDWRDTIGVETMIPIINSKSIKGGEERIKESLGGNVTSIALVNLEVAPIFTLGLDDVHAIFKSLAIITDKYRIDDTMDRMITRRYMQFDYNNIADTRWNTFVYVPHSDVDQTQLSCVLEPTLVNAGMNYIVWRSYHVDGHTIKRAHGLHKKHDERNAAKVQRLAGKPSLTA